MTITGGCLCGAVRFEADAAPVSVIWCHCQSCRRHTGAPVAAYADFDRAAVRFTRGEPVRYVSSPGALRGFCGVCGSTLSFEGETTPTLINIHIGALDAPADFAPSGVSFPDERLPWLCLGPQGPDA